MADCKVAKNWDGYQSLAGVDLSGCNLCKADLSKADLSRANLSGTDLSRANLSRANLSGANLEQASLDAAVLNGVGYVMMMRPSGRSSSPPPCRRWIALVGYDLGEVKLNGCVSNCQKVCIGRALPLTSGGPTLN